MTQASEAKILIVDDDPVLRESLGDLLQALGYGVTSAADGLDALNYLRSHQPPDLILCDLRMPRMNGWVFRLEQQKDTALAEIPTVIVSGKEAPAPAAEYLDAVDFIEKPMDPERLLSILHRHCEPRAKTAASRKC